MQPIGDLASFLFSSRFQSDLKSDSQRAAKAMTTGQVDDKAQHLGGSTMALSLLERKSVLLQQYKLGISEASMFARVTQAALGQIRDQVEGISGTLVLTEQIDDPATLSDFSETARNAFNDIVRSLNSEFAGRQVFSGSATSQAPLPDGDAILADIGAIVMGVTNANDLEVAISAWFDTPGGGFETTAYAGSDAGFVSLPLGAGDVATFGTRADDPVIRDTLKSLAVAVFSSDPALGMSITEQKLGLIQSREGLAAANRNLIEEQSSLGLTEALIDRARQQTVDALSNLDMDRQNLVGVDQFEQASRFEATQQQLELLYRIAARQNRTSLAEYLR